MSNVPGKLSVVIICRDEEENIRDCLESVKWADEIVVVDSGSSDRTLEIAREYTDCIHEHEWEGYGAQKEYAMRLAGGDWVLNVDADERVSAELASEIRKVLLQETPEPVAYSVPRKTFYLGRWITHGGWYPDRKVRLVRRGRGTWGRTPIHESLTVDGAVAKLKGDLYHFTYRDLSDHLKVIDNFTTVAAQQMAGRRTRGILLRLILHPPWKFVRMYLLKLGFLDGTAGLIVASLGAYYVFLKYAKLWELRHAGERSG